MGDMTVCMFCLPIDGSITRVRGLLYKRKAQEPNFNLCHSLEYSCLLSLSAGGAQKAYNGGDRWQRGGRIRRLCVTYLLEWMPVHPIPGLSPALRQMLTADISPPLVSSQNGARETRAEIPFWWLVTTQLLSYYPTIWVVLLINRFAWEIYFSLSEALPRCG